MSAVLHGIGHEPHHALRPHSHERLAAHHVRPSAGIRLAGAAEAAPAIVAPAAVVPYTMTAHFAKAPTPASGIALPLDVIVTASTGDAITGLTITGCTLNGVAVTVPPFFISKPIQDGAGTNSCTLSGSGKAGLYVITLGATGMTGPGPTLSVKY